MPTRIRSGVVLLLTLSGSLLIGLFAGTKLTLYLQHRDDVQRFRELRQAAAEPFTPVAVLAQDPTSPEFSQGRVADTVQAPPVVDQALWSSQRRRAYRDASAAGRSAPEGILRIPAVGVDVAVYSGTEKITLERGAGRIESTPSLGSVGNVGVAAHRDGFFRALKDIATGDDIFVELIDRDLRYVVTDLYIVAPEDIWVLAPTAGHALTLVTCYPFYYLGSAPQRFIVRAELTEQAL